MVGAGYEETYSLPLVAPADLRRAGNTATEVIEVENPLRAEESVLRPALLPGLLRAISFNAAHGEPDVALFEMGTVFAPPHAGERLPFERLHVAFATAGTVTRVPHEPNRPVDVYDATAALTALATELRLDDVRLEPGIHDGFRAGRSASVRVGESVLGVVGEIALTVVDALGIAAPVVACELDVNALLDAPRRDRRADQVSRFPLAAIDLAFIVDEAVPAHDIEATLAQAGGVVLESIRLFDVFRSDDLGAGKVSLAYALRFRHPDRTMTDEEVSGLRQRCIDAVVAAHNAVLR
jgi:phenylalanyl-tRNA synthetase beta chain